MRRFLPHCGAAACLVAAIACYDDHIPILAANPPPGADEVLSTHDLEAASFGKAFLGGATTVFDATESAFSTPAPNLDADALELHEEGNKAFGDVFEVATSIGPLFHNTSCEGCHIEDGRGRPPNPGEQIETMLFRVSASGPQIQALLGTWEQANAATHAAWRWPATTSPIFGKSSLTRTVLPGL